MNWTHFALRSALLASLAGAVGCARGCGDARSGGAGRRCGLLVSKLIQIGRDEKLDRIVAEILPENEGMRRICQKLGFEMSKVPGGTKGVHVANVTIKVVPRACP